MQCGLAPVRMRRCEGEYVSNRFQDESMKAISVVTGRPLWGIPTLRALVVRSLMSYTWALLVMNRVRKVATCFDSG
jgi:hypothetical protein